MKICESIDGKVATHASTPCSGVPPKTSENKLHLWKMETFYTFDFFIIIFFKLFVMVPKTRCRYSDGFCEFPTQRQCD